MLECVVLGCVLWVCVYVVMCCVFRTRDAGAQEGGRVAGRCWHGVGMELIWSCRVARGKGARGHGDMGTWGHGDMGTWGHGDMGTWWHGGMVAWWHGGMVAWWHGGMVAWWHGGMVAWWHGGIVAWWRGGGVVGCDEM